VDNGEADQDGITLSEIELHVQAADGAAGAGADINGAGFQPERTQVMPGYDYGEPADVWRGRRTGALRAILPCCSVAAFTR
jgi:hypothetical protein